MLKQLTIGTAVIAAAAVTYFVHDYLTSDKDEANSAEADTPEDEADSTEAKDEESGDPVDVLKDTFDRLNDYAKSKIDSVREKTFGAAEADAPEDEAPRGDARVELRDALDMLDRENQAIQTRVRVFTKSPSAEDDGDAIVKMVVDMSMTLLNEKVSEFLARATEYPFSELSDEEVLDVLNETKKQVEGMEAVAKELNACMDPASVIDPILAECRADSDSDKAAYRKADQAHTDWVDEMTYAACEVDDGEVQ